MTSDYAAIREENKEEYGNIARWGPKVLTERYDNRTHFIFELLQNAEDALARRSGSKGPRAVTFALSRDHLRISHFGQPFTECDVRGICGIGESTKEDLTAIGRFGIGFKSVYSFTDRPQVHSGEEDFAIENYVLPTAAPPIHRDAEETVFVLPLDEWDETAHAKIIEGFRQLGPRTLLFLRQIEEIAWVVEGGSSGLYLRSKPEKLGENIRRIALRGEEQGNLETEQTWLVFSREARTAKGAVAGYVEIAFMLVPDHESGRLSIQTISDSPLVVFFPTVVATNLGFLVQGPYQTTLSRDNVPPSEPWNKHLVEETASLLVEALRWLRDNDLLNTDALRCLPLEPARFSGNSMFAPLFEAVRDALVAEPLLPRFGGGHVPASQARLSRSQDLRDLLGPAQLSSIFEADTELAWLSGDITEGRTSGLWRYLTGELGVTAVTPTAILPRLDEVFLEAQPDDWILKLYEFLHKQPALRRRLDEAPLVRLEDGTHVKAKSNGQSRAFLPGAIVTDFPTVRRSVCDTDEARQFLHSLGLTEPDPVDDVVRNVLPRFDGEEVEVDDKDYEADVRRVLKAFDTDSTAQREKLISALRDTAFVKAVDAGDGSKRMSKPGDVYLATDRLKELFQGVGGVLLLDDSYACLRGSDARELLERSGATRYLQRVPVSSAFTRRQLHEMRRSAGWEQSTRGEKVEDATLRGLNQLLSALPEFDAETQANKALLLWEALADLAERRGTGAFSGTYRWFYRDPHSATFDADFVRRLNKAAWVPDPDGGLQRPEFVVFESLGWANNPFLLSKIRFKPPIIETLAKEAGIEPGVLDLLKMHGVTSVAELQSRLGIEARPEAPVAGGASASEEAAEASFGESAEEMPNVPGPSGYEAPGPDGGSHGVSATGGGSGSREPGISPEGPVGDGTPEDGPSGGGGAVPHQGESMRAPGSPGGRPFISYVSAHLDEEEEDPDGLDQQARMALEDKGIRFILKSEPQLQRTPPFNPGYDLYEVGPDGQPERWIEAKSMTGSLYDRPVTISHTQFDCAREKGAAYWLYVVEHAGDDDGARVVRIQDPAGKIRSFTFDRGWLDVADVDGAVGSDPESEAGAQ